MPLLQDGEIQEESVHREPRGIAMHDHGSSHGRGVETPVPRYVCAVTSVCVLACIPLWARRRPQYPGVLHSTLYYMYKPARKIVIASVSKTAEHDVQHAANVV